MVSQGRDRGMRAYFTVMQKGIRTNQGLVLQYVGDQVGAVFGVPLRHDDHADRAVLVALEMRKSLDELNQHRIREENPPLDTASGFVPGRYWLVILAVRIGSPMP